jgi:Pyruvate/2-oxoacid:ferredoxin oxidoreductase gamma subunit
VAGAAGLAAYAALVEPALGLLGLAGLVLVLLAVALGRAGLVAPGLVVVLAGYATSVVVRDSAALEPAAPLVGGGLLVVAELAYWSVELRGKEPEERLVVFRRLATLVALTAGAVVLGAGVLAAAAALPLGGGLVWNVVGVAAAVAALAVIARLASVERSGGFTP